MADYLLIGKDIAPQDQIAKITGRAKYAEDFRAPGMLFAKLLPSPMPHARVRSIDYSEALAMPGVVAVLTADEVPQRAFPYEPVLTNEPRYEGEAILAVAAVDEITAAEAIERVRIDLEPLPFVIDPLNSMRPNGPNAHLDGNVWLRVTEGATANASYGAAATTAVGLQKWTQAEFDAAGPNGFPAGKHADEWTIGDVDAGFAQADVVIEETIYHHCQSHNPMEPRTSMAYWQNGRVFLHSSVQSVAQARRTVADNLGLDLEDVVLVSEFCGGGFGGKARGTGIDILPALLSRKTGRPVMLRITRAEETLIGRARNGMMGRVRMGFRRDGRMTALDLYLLQDNGPYARQGDYLTAGDVASLTFTPENMRFRSIAVLTNTPPRAAQRSPGGAQCVAMLGPVFDRAARQLGMDRLELWKINAPGADVAFGSVGTTLTSCNARETLEKGGELFGWEERVRRSGERTGSKVRGVGVALGAYTAGSSGWDGLAIIRPDGKLYIHQGVGNLGTNSVMDTARVAAEVVGMPWDRCEIIYGNTSRHLPHSSNQVGSQTAFAHSRANYALGLAIRQKLKEIAALDMGGSAEDYEVGGERVYRQGSPETGLSFARAAQRAIELGGSFDGHVLPEEINEMTVTSATALAGQGLVVAARDNIPHTTRTYSFVASFVELDLDVETGVVDILDATSVADCGTVLHPRSLAAQTHSGVLQGIGMVHSQKWAIDPTWGYNLTKRMEASKPPSILDIPLQMKFAALELPDPENPIGVKGIGEPPVGSGAAAFISAVEDALGGMHQTHVPLTPDKLINLVEYGCLPCGRLETHI